MVTANVCRYPEKSQDVTFRRDTSKTQRKTFDPHKKHSSLQDAATCYSVSSSVKNTDYNTGTGDDDSDRMCGLYCISHKAVFLNV